MSTGPSPRARALTGAVVAALAAAALSACGGTAAGSGNPTSQTASDEAKAEQFAKCLREHGIEAHASKGGAPGGGGFGLKVTGKAGSGGGPQAFEAAQKACAKYQPHGPNENLSPAQEAERRDRVLRFARCMRAHGINVPDPEVKGGGVRIHIEGNLNPESPRFQAAQRACQSLLPGLKRNSGPSTQSSTGGGQSAGTGP
jgi:hypothetical protein